MSTVTSGIHHVTAIAGGWIEGALPPLDRSAVGSE
jgi:hypothetical protein